MTTTLQIYPSLRDAVAEAFAEAFADQLRSVTLARPDRPLPIPHELPGLVVMSGDAAERQAGTGMIRQTIDVVFYSDGTTSEVLDLDDLTRPSSRYVRGPYKDQPSGTLDRIFPCRSGLITPLSEGISRTLLTLTAYGWPLGFPGRPQDAI